MKKYDGRYEGEDTQCNVYCKCGNKEPISIGHYDVFVCPVCGRGYKSEFVVWQFSDVEVLKITGKMDASTTDKNGKKY